MVSKMFFFLVHENFHTGDEEVWEQQPSHLTAAAVDM
jgi:hypothetical protein